MSRVTLRLRLDAACALLTANQDLCRFTRPDRLRRRRAPENIAVEWHMRIDGVPGRQQVNFVTRLPSARTAPMAWAVTPNSESELCRVQRRRLAGAWVE